MNTHPLLQTLLDYGDQMEAALRDLDIDRFEALVDARYDLIELLKESGPPATLDPQWHAVAIAYERQERVIMAEVERCRQSLEDALTSSSKMNNASRVYRNERHGGSVLHDGLSA